MLVDTKNTSSEQPVYLDHSPDGTPLIFNFKYDRDYDADDEKDSSTDLRKTKQKRKIRSKNSDLPKPDAKPKKSILKNKISPNFEAESESSSSLSLKSKKPILPRYPKYKHQSLNSASWEKKAIIILKYQERVHKRLEICEAYESGLTKINNDTENEKEISELDMRLRAAVALSEQTVYEKQSNLCKI